MRTIKLTVEETSKTNKIYYLSSITEEQRIKLFKAKKEDNLKSINTVIGINCENIIKFGETKLAKYNSISDFIGFFYGAITSDKPKLNSNRPLQFRNYNIKEEEQNKNRHLLGEDYPDSVSSAKSALALIDEKYCCLWWDFKGVQYDHR